jgi:DNA anti-recombination protein RmuC
MTDEVFRIAIVVGVGVICLSFLALAAGALMMVRRIRKLEESAAPLMERAGPLLQKIEPMVERTTILLEKGAPVMEKAGVAIEQVKALTNTANKTLASANRLLDEVRPQAIQVSNEAVAIVQSGRAQVERLGGVLFDASNRAKERLEQIDHSLENTVEQVENMGGTVKRAVLRPVREVNGLAAGISAAVSTLVKGPHKSSVDTAVQDEEMFI